MKVFIAHSWDDNETSRMLSESLKHDGITPWIDYEMIKSGDSIANRINAALEWCDILILIWSKSAEQSHYVQLEWQASLSLGKIVIPCVLDDTNLPPLLSRLVFIDFSSFSTGYKELIKAIRSVDKPEEKEKVKKTFELEKESFKKATKKKEKIFLSYSHHDKFWLERLHIHLKPLTKILNSEIEIWDDRTIKAGAKWRDEISNALDSAGIAILMISADFLASDFIMNDEVPVLLSNAKKQGTIIIPLILSPCLFLKIDYLSQYKAANDPMEPIKGMDENEQEKTFLEVALTILASLSKR